MLLDGFPATKKYPSPVERLVRLAGQDFDDYKCRVTNPCITAREGIIIGNYIVELEKKLAQAEARIEEVLEQNRNFLRELDIKTQQAKEYQRLLIKMDEKSR